MKATVFQEKGLVAVEEIPTLSWRRERYSAELSIVAFAVPTYITTPLVYLLLDLY